MLCTAARIQVLRSVHMFPGVRAGACMTCGAEITARTVNDEKGLIAWVRTCSCSFSETYLGRKKEEPHGST